MNTKEKFGIEEIIKHELTVSDENWTGENTTELILGGATIGDLYGTDDYPCLDDEENNIAEIKKDNIVIGRLVCASPKMFEKLRQAAKLLNQKGYSMFAGEIEELLNRITER